MSKTWTEILGGDPELCSIAEPDQYYPKWTIGRRLDDVHFEPRMDFDTEAEAKAAYEAWFTECIPF